MIRSRLPAPLKLLGLMATAAALTLLPSVSAMAAWSVAGSGSAAGAAAVMPTGLAPTASATGTQVALRWPAVTLSSGAAVSGYVVVRINTINGSSVAAGGTCAGTVTTTTCTDSPTPSGAWAYADTPVQASWTGGQSPPSNTVTVP
jgi:hypothetical protein